MPTTIHLASGDYTSSIVKRTLGKLNIGFYCDCGEFIAVSVTEPYMAEQLTFACDGPLQLTCPFCGTSQTRVVTQFEKLILTERNKRSAPRAVL
jgi:hypothetical protein